MRTTTITLLAISLRLATLAQSNIGIKINGGASSVFSNYVNSSNINGSANPTGTVTVTNLAYFTPSGQCGIYYELHFPYKFSVGAELLYNQVNGKQYFLTSVPSPFGNWSPLYNSDHTWQHLSYISIPVYLAYSFNKLSVNFGPMFNIAIAASGEDNGQSYQFTDFVFGTWNNKINASSVSTLNYGIRAGFAFKLSNKISINASYFIGSCSFNYLRAPTDMFNYWDQNPHYYIQQITAGLEYSLVTFGKSKSEKANDTK